MACLLAVVGGMAEDSEAQERASDGDSLFDVDLKDDNVELLLDGLWDVTVGGTIGWILHPPAPDTGAESTFTQAIPGLDPLPLLSNAVDLTISLWLFERYFLEATIVDEVALNSLIAGYQGKEGEVVQSVRFGYGLFSLSPYPYIDLSGAKESAFGFSALFETGLSRHELLLRYERSERESVRFLGMRRIESGAIELADYLRGRFFVLPDEGIDELELYVESEGGAFAGDDGRYYDRVDIEDYAHYSRQHGTLALDEASSVSVLVHYRVNGVPVGDTRLGRGAIYRQVNGVVDVLHGPEDFDFETTPELAVGLSGGRVGLLLYRPGTFSPFEALNRYHAELPSGADEERVILRFVGRVDEVERTIDERYLRIASEEDVIEIVNVDYSERHHVNRYPLAEELPLLYGSRSNRSDTYTDIVIETLILDPLNALTLPADAIPGSETIIRNGVVDRNIIVDPETNRVLSGQPILPNDLIELFYRTDSDLGGELIVGSGNSFYLLDGLLLQVAFGMRWHLMSVRYSVEPDRYPGQITLSASADYERDTLAVGLQGALQVRVPDTTGHLRLAGMEERIDSPALEEESLFPSAAPLDWDPAPGLQALSNERRGRLLYRDYNSVSASGSRRLLDYDEPLSSEQIYDYEPGSRIGPYLVGTDGETEGAAMALDFELDREQWVGGQTRLVRGAVVDLSEVSEVSFLWRATELSGEVAVRLQIGAVGEDLDGDGLLDEGQHAFAPDFAFDDGSSGFSLRVGVPLGINQQAYSEDGDGNGVLDREESDLIYSSVDIASSGALFDPPVDEWRSVRLILSAEERAALRLSRAIRIIVRNGGATEADGRLLFSQFRLHGASARGERASGEISVRERGDNPPAGIEPLTERFPEVQEVFHFDGADQQVLQIDWAAGGSSEWTVSDWVIAVPYGQYRYLVYYLRIADLPDDGVSELEISLTDRPFDRPGARGIASTIALDGDDRRWRKVELDTLEDRIRVDGETRGVLSRSDGAGEKVGFLRFRFNGSDVGTLLIDEVHWAESRPRFDGAGSASLAWSHPDPLWSAGKLPLFGNISVEQRVDIYSRGFDAEVADYREGVAVDTFSNVGIDLLGAHIEANLVLSSGTRSTPFIDAGHSIRIPAIASPVTFIDAFQRDWNAVETSLYRSNSLIVEVADMVLWRFDTQALARVDNLQQSWLLGQDVLSKASFWFEWEVGAEHSTLWDEPPREGYLASWLNGYHLILPYTENDERLRSMELTARFAVDADPFHARLDPSLSYRNESATAGLQSNQIDVALGFPLNFADGQPTQWTIEPFYERALAYEREDDDNLNWGDDLQLYFGELGRQRLFYAGIPFYELVDPDLRSDFADDSAHLSEARYEPSTGVQFRRRTGSSWIDLLLPESTTLQFARSISRREERLLDTRRWTFTWTTLAINLFGRVGAYPIIPLYRIDEFAGALSLSVLYTEPDESIGWDGSLDHRFTFYGTLDRRLSLENSLGLSYDDALTITLDTALLFEWRGEERRRFGREGSYFTHSESLGFGITPRYDDYDTNLYTLSARHETALRFPAVGQVGFFLGMVWATQPFEIDEEDVSRTFIGLQGGLEGRLQL